MINKWKKFSLCNLVAFSLQKMATLRNKRRWQPLQEKHKKIILGTASQETRRPFLELTRNISLRFLKRLKAESLKNCPRSSAGQIPAFWLLCLNQTNFSSTHRYGRTAELFRDHFGGQRWTTRNQMRIVSRLTLILKWDPPSPSPIVHLIQTQTGLLTSLERTAGWDLCPKSHMGHLLDLPFRVKKKEFIH